MASQSDDGSSEHGEQSASAESATALRFTAPQGIDARVLRRSSLREGTLGAAIPDGPFESVPVDGGGVCRHEAAVSGRRRAERKLAVQFQVGRAFPPVVHPGDQLGVVQNVVDRALTARDKPVAWY